MSLAIRDLKHGDLLTTDHPVRIYTNDMYFYREGLLTYVRPEKDPEHDPSGELRWQIVVDPEGNYLFVEASEMVTKCSVIPT